MASGRDNRTKTECVEVLSFGGVPLVAQLIQFCAVAGRRRLLAEQSGIDERLLLEWRAMVKDSNRSAGITHYDGMFSFSSMEKKRAAQSRRGDRLFEEVNGVKAEPK